MSEEQGSESAVSRRQAIKEDEMAKEKEAPKKVSRREFVKGAAVGGAGVAAAGMLASCAPAPTTAPEAAPTCPPAAECPLSPVAGVPETWDKEADVIVVGTGPAGAVAAAVAVEAGATVILLDMNDEFGGQGVICGGGLLIGGGTRIQELNGITDTPDILFAHMSDPKVRDYRRHDPAVLRAWCDYSPIAFAWLEEHGVKFSDELSPLDMGSLANRIEYNHRITWDQPTKNNPTAKGTWNSGAGLLLPLQAIATEKGVEILLEHKMTKIIREGGMAGRALGVEVEAGGEKLYFKARKGVILGTGSWKGHKWLRKLYDPRATEDIIESGQPFVSVDGSGIQAGLEVGGVLATDAASCWHGWHRHWGTLYHNFPLGSPYAAHGLDISGGKMANVIIVNKSGTRFLSEAASEKDEIEGSWYDFALPQEDHILWAIFDDAAAKREEWDPNPPVVEEDLAFSAPTIGELATLIGVPGDALSETVSRYNTFVDAGEDTDFGKPKDLLTYKIETPPFYGVWVSIQIHDTAGGLAVNDKFQVMDVYGDSIPGLYAAGEAAGSLIFSSGMVKAVAPGYICGENAAAEEPWE